MSASCAKKCRVSASFESLRMYGAKRFLKIRVFVKSNSSERKLFKTCRVCAAFGSFKICRTKKFLGNGSL